ncbi:MULTISPECIES: hypothetical protein [unclassified Thermoactinomyces]|jgi:hypothetical protein|uniref:hypothetical protein n=1 Tax=unclassified Thermoactinomyces TaxID=2634588 RepID=UPI0018DCDAD4|nr:MULTISPECIES: hypothetical protein [unclassified Thermoactinomyces]MBH8599356.1 hypothetical protein [Thermoactinomyces sp. CICC 10523]MBH8608322.1 hypothetical protein [Thermoactinomyces sp. CICC 10521]
MKWRHGVGGLICLFFLLSLPVLAYAEDSKQPEKTPTLDELNSRVADLEDHREFLKDLEDEVKNYRDHVQAEMTSFQDSVQKERDSLFTLFQFFLVLQTALLGAGVAIIYFSIGQTKNDLRKLMESELNQTKKELNNKFKERLEEEKRTLEKQVKNELALALEGYQHQMAKVKSQMEKQYQDMLEQFTRETEQDLVALKKNIENEKTFTSSRIWVMGPGAEIEKMKTEEVDLIRRRGIKHIKVALFDRDQLRQALENHEIDILIYRYVKPADGSMDQELIAIAKLLIERKDEIPLLVYGANLDKEEMNVLNDYKFLTISNFRMTLISNIFSLAYAFNKQSNQ